MHAAIVTGVARPGRGARPRSCCARGVVDGGGRRPHARARRPPERVVSGTSPATSRIRRVVAAAVLPALRDACARAKPSAGDADQQRRRRHAGRPHRTTRRRGNRSRARDQRRGAVRDGRSLLPRASRRVDPRAGSSTSRRARRRRLIAGQRRATRMSKAALEMLTRAVIADHPDRSIECITLRPGIFETAMQQFMRQP